MKHLKPKRPTPRKRQARRRDALAWLVIAIELVAIAVLVHAAMTDKHEPVELSPEMTPPVHIITPEPEKESPRYSAANPAERLDSEEEEQGSGADAPSAKEQSEADFATTDKLVETPVPTWDVVPSLGDDVDPPQGSFATTRTSPEDIELIARTIWGEAENVKSTMEKAAVAWCICNRVDSDRFPDTIAGVVTAEGQFHGFRSAEVWGDCPEYYIDLATDVVTRWEREQAGEEDVGRVLPPEFIYFEGDLTAHNYFRTEWMGGLRWWWTLENPYES